MPPPTDRALHELSEADRARLARSLMRRQGALSVRVAAAFLVLILGLPLLNALAPEAMNAAWAGGITPTWLFLGVLFYPITVALSFYFVGASDRIEAECADWRRALDAEEGR